MAFIQGEGRSQGTLFPVTLDELIPEDHVCRVIDAFVGRLDVAGLGFERAEAAETGRPGYDPRDLLKLYLYGYLQQIRSSRRLESECQRNVELMWLLGRCRLLQWRTGRSLRGARNPSSYTQQSCDQQSRRRHILRPHPSSTRNKATRLSVQLAGPSPANS
jgi:hypothetical protein